MDLRRLCLLAAVSVISRADSLTRSINDIQATIAFDRNLVAINGTLRLDCSLTIRPMTSGSFWATGSVFSWSKRQPINNATYEVIRDGTPTFPETANRYAASRFQPASNTFLSNLTIADFRREDYGFYSCSVSGPNSAQSLEVFVQAEPSASVSINIASDRLSGVYVYGRNTSRSNTSCTSHISGDATNTSMQMIYGDKDVTDLFWPLNATHVVGNVSGFQAVVSVRTLQSTSFAPPSDVQSPLECRVRLRNGTIIARGAVLIRSSDEGSKLICSQDPPEAEIGSEVKITCEVSHIQLNQSHFEWTFERKNSAAGSQQHIKVVDGEDKVFAFAVPFAAGSRLTIRKATSDVDFVNVVLFHQGKEIVSLAYPLDVKGEPPVASGAMVGSPLEWISVWVLLASMLFSVYGR